MSIREAHTSGSTHCALHGGSGLSATASFSPESAAPVMVFDTWLPTRYDLDRSAVDFSRLQPTETVTSCPYKGQTTDFWSVVVGESVYPDLAWSYNFPTRQLLPIAGLVAFYNEQVDVFLDGVEQPQPITHFFT